MICEQGKVVSVEGDVAFVEVIQQSSCQACSANKACGTKVLKALFQTKRHYLKLPFSHLNQEPVIGDSVEIEIDESALLKSSFLVYVLPLISLVAMALAFDAWFQSELLSMLGAVVGFILALLIARFYAVTTTHSHQFQPRLVKVLPKNNLVEELLVIDAFNA